MTGDALFRPEGSSTFVPTDSAVSAWDPTILHGAAAAALLAGQMQPADRTLARLTIDFLAPVPLAPLTLERGEPVGGRRVQRQEAVLSCADRPVMVARSVLVARDDLDLPERALTHPSPFDPAATPPLDEPNRAAAEIVGRESFDSICAIVERMRVEGDRRVHQWISLVVPVVEGTEISPLEVAAVAADYAQAAIHRTLPMPAWSFRNAELTLHLARAPVGTWVGVRCEGVVQPVGAGFNAADLFDADGRVGRSAATVVVERGR